MTTALFTTATEDEVRELVDCYALDEKRVRAWDRTKVQVMLDSHRRADAITRRRAAKAAEAFEDDAAPAPVSEPSALERQVAADFLEGALKGDLWQLQAGLLCVSHAFTCDEVRRVAGYFVRMLRGEDAQRRAPATAG